jgi:hypothetical protein
MKRFLPFILGLTSLALHAQKNTQLSYEEHLNYSLGAYLNTPLSNIRVAGAKWLSGDTTAAIQYVQAAVRVGMYDSFMVKSSPYLNGFTALKEWNTIRLSIDKNIETVSHPSQLKIYTDDVKRFFRLLPKMTGKQGESVFWKEYIAAGTTGLKTFYNVRMSSRPDVTTYTIRKYQSFYKGLEPLVAQLPSFEKRIMAAADKLEAIYPEAFYPPVYFLVGNMNAAGTPDGGAGQLVGIEFFSNYPGRDTAGLSKWFRSVISDTSRVVGLTVHEMIHIQQKNLQSQTVLAKVLTEGACDFITYLLLNEIILPRQHAYGNAHEKEIYDRLIKEKATTDLSYWMYNSEIEEKGIPSDLGYYIGFKICEAYYNKQTDKKQAVKDILEIRNYEQFLKESGYGDQFQ